MIPRAPLLFRRLPGFALRRKMTVVGFCCFIFIVGYFAFATGLICTTFEPAAVLHKLCHEFHTRKSLGDLCQSLCLDRGVEKLTCVDGSVRGFGVTLRGGTDVIIKPAFRLGKPPEDFHWVDSDNVKSFPSEEQFMTMVQQRIKTRLNWTLEENEAKRLTHFPGGQTSQDLNSELRSLEMKEVWGLLHNYEYLLTMLHSRREIFTDLVGSCGQYYVTEKLDLPLIKFQSEGLNTNFDSWAARVRLSVGILELVELLDEDGILICDVRPNHFGTDAGGKVKLVNLEGTLLKRIADTMISSGRSCSNDKDCSLIDCQSVCNHKTRSCDSPIISTNLQVVCKKIFLGWSSHDHMITPGLLMTDHTPQSLLSLLRQCAHPSSMVNDVNERIEFSRTIEQKLDNALTELDKSLDAFRS